MLIKSGVFFLLYNIKILHNAIFKIFKKNDFNRCTVHGLCKIGELEKVSQLSLIYDHTLLLSSLPQVPRQAGKPGMQGSSPLCLEQTSGSCRGKSASSHWNFGNCGTWVQLSCLFLLLHFDPREPLSILLSPSTSTPGPWLSQHCKCPALPNCDESSHSHEGELSNMTKRSGDSTY